MRHQQAIPEFEGTRRGRVRNSYDAGATTRRTLGWRAPTVSPNSVLYSLATLRDRSRAARRNDGYAKGAIDKLVTNIIGTGINPLSQADDPAFRKQVQELWLKWTDESDADGLLDWNGQQTQAARAWLSGGETFVRMRARLPGDVQTVPLQLQILEPELCPHTHTMQLANGVKVRAGIEFDGIGRRSAYWFHPSRPGDLEDFDTSVLRRVPADSVTHMFEPDRPGQLRGIPFLTTSLIRLHEVDKFDDATLLRQQLANLFVAFVERPTPTGDEATTNPLTGETAPTDDPPSLALEPGIFQELNPGEKVTFSEPPGAPNGYGDYMRQQLAAVSAATGVPYEVLTGDMRGVSDRTLRVILYEFRRGISAWQHQVVVFQFCRPIWQAWFDRAVLSGKLRVPAAYYTDPTPWSRVKWLPQGWPYLHPVQDVEADKKAIRAGFTSRSAVVGEQGEDAAVIDAEQQADNARADALQLTYDSDARKPENAAAPAPAGDPIPPADPAAPAPAE